MRAIKRAGKSDARLWLGYRPVVFLMVCVLALSQLVLLPVEQAYGTGFPGELRVRAFDGIDDNIITSIGALQDMQYGTIAAVIKVGSGTGHNPILGILEGDQDGVLQARSDGLWQIFPPSGSAGRGGSTPYSAWVLVVARFANDSNQARFSTYNMETQTWAHASSNSSVPAWSSSPGSSAEVGFFFGGEIYNGRIATRAVWSNALPWSADSLGDSVIESAGLELSLQSWADTNPSALWVFNQASVGDPVLDLTGNGADEIGRVGTTVVTNDVPPDFDFSTGGPTASGNSIRMSSASQAAENVDYRLRLLGMENVQSMVIDFCSNSPLAGTDCTAPAGMDTGNVDIGSGSGDWSAAPGGAPNRVELSKDTLHDSGTIALTMAGIDNPTEVGVFYARIYAYEDETNAYSSPTDLGTGEEDEPKYLAAVALAITDDIGVTLIIPEYIEFCVYDIECGDTPAIVLGQGDPPALSTSQVDSESVQFEVATNASLGVSLRIKGPTLNMGSSEIPPNCSVDSWFDPGMPRGTALTAGTAGFGVEAVVDGYIPPNTGDEDQLEPHPAYLDWDFSGSASMGDYAFFGGCGQEQGYDTEPDSEYGSTFAFSNGPLSGASGDLVFRAAISNATAAGIYQTTLQVIATGYY